MNPSNHKNFSVKVWIFSALVTPILGSLFYIITNEVNPEFIFFAILFVFPLGLLISLPCVIMLTFFTKKVNHYFSNNFDKKVIISCLATVLTLGLFLIIYVLISSRILIHPEIFILSGAYSSTLIFAIWYFPLTLRKDMIKIISSEDILDEPIF